MLLVGLTGGIASGKSTVSKRLQEQYDLPIIDADKIAREVVLPGKPAYNKVVAEFKDKIPNLLNEDDNKTLNRGELGKHVFGNPNDLRKLNSITHPAIRYEMFWQIVKNWFSFNKMVILDIPLLFESKLDLYCGINLCILCDKDLQLKRLHQRNPELSLQECENRINNQMDNETKSKLADVIIENNSNLEELYDKLDVFVNKIEPSWFFSICEVIIPPLGLLSAFICFMKNRLKFKDTDIRN